MEGGYISVEAVYGVLGDTFLKWDIWWRAFHRGPYRFSSFLIFFDNTVSVTIPEGQQNKAHDTVMN